MNKVKVYIILVSLIIASNSVIAQLCGGTGGTDCTCTESDCIGSTVPEYIPASSDCASYYLCYNDVAAQGPLPCDDGDIVSPDGCVDSLQISCPFLNDKHELCQAPPVNTDQCIYSCPTSLDCDNGGSYLLPSNEDCGTYYDCCDTAKPIKECPQGTVFDGQVCIVPGSFPSCCDEIKEKCDATTLLECDGKYGTGIYELPNLDECSQFYTCLDAAYFPTADTPESVSCAAGDKYNPLTGQCEEGTCQSYCELASDQINPSSTILPTSTSSATSTTPISSTPITSTTTSSKQSTSSTISPTPTSTVPPMTSTIVPPDPTDSTGCLTEATINCDNFNLDYVPKCTDRCDEQYYYCVDSSGALRNCPPGYVFDPSEDINTCVGLCSL